MISARVDTCSIHFLVGEVLGHHYALSGRTIIGYGAVRNRSGRAEPIASGDGHAARLE
jgi:hypothetical protein